MENLLPALAEQWEGLLRLLLATLLGAVVGFERERADKPAGLRTHILVSLGAALFTLASIYGFRGGVEGDPGRVAAQVVTGIGFLGAGAIFRMEGVVRGLTTAASIWAVAAIGLAAGAGLYLLAVGATLVVFIVLYAIRGLEERV